MQVEVVTSMQKLVVKPNAKNNLQHPQMNLLPKHNMFIALWQPPSMSTKMTCPKGGCTKATKMLKCCSNVCSVQDDGPCATCCTWCFIATFNKMVVLQNGAWRKLAHTKWSPTCIKFCCVVEQNVEQEQNGNCNKLTCLKPMVFSVSRINLLGRSLDKVQQTQNGDVGSMLMGVQH